MANNFLFHRINFCTRCFLLLKVVLADQSAFIKVHYQVHYQRHYYRHYQVQKIHYQSTEHLYKI